MTALTAGKPRLPAPVIAGRDGIVTARAADEHAWASLRWRGRRPRTHGNAESWWSTVTVEATPTRGVETLDRVVIRFAGDSGDGMQLVGDRFTELSAAFGNDLATLPNFPAEIRAPAGTIAGVSSFQVHISDHDIVTPGDVPNVLVAMNPAALKANMP